jgi:hypothetical protein|tara:strand:+ start:5937 stop:6974 length:1038 start_codon:yes stop_codon:yes gene_type:complete
MYRFFISIIIVSSLSLFAQNRNGTTSANFIEIDVGSAASGMGGAYVCMTHDVSSIYWNPANIVYLNKNELLLIHEPWIAETNRYIIAAGIKIDNSNSLGFSFNYLDYGSIEVTNVMAQDGTGEYYNPKEYSIGLSYAKKFVDWFSFGSTLKYISSQIWHSKASASAIDLGVFINTPFISMTGNHRDGLRIGMSISNYGSKMKYEGIDLLNPIDISSEYGNYSNVEGQFKTQGWELPLLLRIGISIKPMVTQISELILSMDAIHPNNNSEYINLGSQFTFSPSLRNKFYLRSGYKGLFMVNGEFGPAFGCGMQYELNSGQGIKIDYSYRSIITFNNTHNYTLSLTF